MRCLAFLAVVFAATATMPAAAPPTPILVELFTSEGCESCPPADTLLQKFLDAAPTPGAEILALGQHVDYWDQLGWKDRFSSAVYTSRQQVYAARLGTDSYTPQMVVDGRVAFVGSDADAAHRAFERAQSLPHGVVRIAMDGGSATITVTGLPPISKGDHADILLAVTEDHLRTDVKRGENRGRALTHAAVVRSLTTIGEASATGSTTVSTRVSIGADWRREQVKLVAFVQERRNRAILASAAARP